MLVASTTASRSAAGRSCRSRGRATTRGVAPAGRVRPSSASPPTLPESRGSGIGRALTDASLRTGPRSAGTDDGHRLAGHEPALVAVLAEARLPAALPAALPLDPSTGCRGSRCPSGARIAVVRRARRRGRARAAAAARAGRRRRAPRCAMRSASRSRASRSRRSYRAAGRATIVVEPPALPIPGAGTTHARRRSPRRSDELERPGVPSRAADDARRRRAHAARPTSASSRARLVSPELRAPLPRHGRGPRRRGSGARSSSGTRASPAARRTARSLETDLVVTVSAAETVLHGGPGACSPPAARRRCARRGAYSLLETAASQGWQLGVELERALADRVPVIGASLVLNLPRLRGGCAATRTTRRRVERIVRSPVRHGFRAAARRRARRTLRSIPRELGAVAAFRRPAVGGARGGAAARGRGALGELGEPLDAIVHRDPAHDTAPAARAPEPAARRVPRPRPRAAALARRVPGRRGRHGDPAPPLPPPLRASDPAAVPRVLPGDARRARTRTSSAQAEREAAADERAIAAYRAGRTCHPLLPFADWAALRAGARPRRRGDRRRLPRRRRRAPARLRPDARHRRGARDGARPRTAADARIGYLLSPPYFPLESARA